MRINVVSDVHGADDALKLAADGADLFVCLGDLILFLDYDDPSQGIYTELFGEDHTRAYIEARTPGGSRTLASSALRHGRGVGA